MNKIYFLLILNLLTLTVFGQNNSSNPHVICFGSSEPYRVDQSENSGQGTTGSTYSWVVTGAGFAGTIQTNQGPSGSSNHVIINWGSTPAGIYTIEVEETGSNSCVGDLKTLNVQIIAKPTVAAIAGDTVLCEGESEQLTNATNGGLWTITNNSIATISNAGMLQAVNNGNALVTYTVTNAQGCSTAVTKNIVVNTTPTVAAIQGTFTICSNSTQVYTNSTSGGTWSSSNTSIAQVDNTGNVTPVNNGTFNLIYTVNAGNCSNQVSQAITVNPSPVAVAQNNGPTCEGGNILLTSSGGTNYNWVGPNSFNSPLQNVTLTNVDATSTGTYTVTVSNNFNCSATISTNVSVNPKPNTSDIFHN